jgi:hypothetical protein
MFKITGWDCRDWEWWSREVENFLFLLGIGFDGVLSDVLE